MSEKPSLYVVEKKEVVVLVILFVLVTVLSFTVGVRYGEKIGRKLVSEEFNAQKEHDGESVEKNGGTLGNTAKSEKTEAAPMKQETNAEEKVGGKLSTEKAELNSKTEKKEEKATADSKVEVNHDTESHAAPVPAATVNAVDANSDEALLSALKGNGIEPQTGNTNKSKSLPSEAKTVKPGEFVIQVGSHPTKREADDQLQILQGHRIVGQILAPFKDSQGEWFRVVIGPYKSKPEAEKDAKGLKSKGYIFSYFVRKM